jgi:hypothetical protein
MNKQTAHEKGVANGFAAAKNCTVSDHDKAEASCPCPPDDEAEFCGECLGHAAFDSEQNARQFSPFEFFANDINETGDRAESIWQAYDEGVALGIRRAMTRMLRELKDHKKAHLADIKDHLADLGITKTRLISGVICDVGESGVDRSTVIAMLRFLGLGPKEADAVSIPVLDALIQAKIAVTPDDWGQTMLAAVKETLGQVTTPCPRCQAMNYVDPKDEGLRLQCQGCGHEFYQPEIVMPRPQPAPVIGTIQPREVREGDPPIHQGQRWDETAEYDRALVDFKPDTKKPFKAHSFQGYFLLLNATGRRAGKLGPGIIRFGLYDCNGAKRLDGEFNATDATGLGHDEGLPTALTHIADLCRTKAKNPADVTITDGVIYNLVTAWWADLYK